MLRPVLVMLSGCLLAGCIPAYKPPESGPVAYVKFTDARPSPLGGRRSTVVLHYSADCSGARQGLEGRDGLDWIALPADQPIVFHQAVHTDRYYCGVWGQLRLKEGQRVWIHYEDMGMRCTVEAREQFADGTGRRMDLQRPSSPQCKR